MNKWLCACGVLLALLLVPIAAPAQQETFSSYVSNLPAAATPLAAGDKFYLLQGGASKAVFAQNVLNNFTAPAHQFVNGIFNSGFLAAQPTTGDISGIGTMATQNANAVGITGGSVTGLPPPISASDAATKAYVDSNISGFRIHNPVVLATAAALPTYTWSATGGGTLTATANGILSIDGVVVTVSTRVLVKNELNSGTACNGNVNAACDGVYNVNQVGTAGTPYILQRTTALNSAGFAENVAAGWAGNDSISVMAGGVANANTVWINTANVVTLNTTAFSFFQFSSTGGGVSSISNGDGTLTIAPTTGVAIAALNLNHANTWTATQTFPNASLTNAMLANSSTTINGTACALGSSCTLGPWTKQINIATTGNFFSNAGGISNNINDKAYFGGATAYPGSSGQDTTSWLGVLHPTMGATSNVLVDAVVGVLTDAANLNAAFAISAAAQTVLATGLSDYISVLSVAVNNNTSFATSVWAYYAEAWRFNSTAGQTNGAEIEVRNLGNNDPADPFTLGVGSTNSQATIGISSGCGAGQANAGTNPCTVAMLVFANLQSWNTGIMFASPGAVISRSGIIHAIDMPTMYQLVWYSAANTIKGSLTFGNLGTFDIVTQTSTININGTDGASCNPGSVNPATLQVVGGLVVHC